MQVRPRGLSSLVQVSRGHERAGAYMVARAAAQRLRYTGGVRASTGKPVAQKHLVVFAADVTHVWVEPGMSDSHCSHQHCPAAWEKAVMQGLCSCMQSQPSLVCELCGPLLWQVCFRAKWPRLESLCPLWLKTPWAWTCRVVSICNVRHGGLVMAMQTCAA